MELFGLTFSVGNKLGYYAFISLLILILFYLMRPKPFKKIIPSLIYLETEKKRLRMTTFFRRFVKDWLFLLHLLLILILCLAALNLTTEIFFKKINKEITFVIDASASSQTKDGKMLFDIYKDYARKNLGVKNSIVLIKNSPEIVVKQTNPINAYKSIAGLKPTESLSNIWDSMMTASQITSPGSSIIVLSDLIDINDRDLSIARKILEAKGFKVHFVNYMTEMSNIGITKYHISGDNAVIDIKNYDPVDRKIRLNNLDFEIGPFAVEQRSIELEEGINKIEIKANDNFAVDDKIQIIKPITSESQVLFITNGQSYLNAVFDSLKNINIEIAEPPIVSIGNQNLFVIDNLNYNKILPGTIEKIKEKVIAGSSLIIAGQENIDKVWDLLPVTINSLESQNVEIINTKTVETLQDYDFGLSQKYYQADLRINKSIVIAEATDKQRSPIIVIYKLGKGSVLFYGILDEYNPFKLSSQYPLFWIDILEIMESADTYKELNLKIGSVIYGENIRDPDNSRLKDYVVLEKTGVYKVDNKEIAVNLLNSKESDLKYVETEYKPIDLEKVEQTLNLLPILIALAILISFIELYILKKRGDI